MRSLRASTPVLLLDNGDVNKGYGRQPELKYETAMRAMSEMGYAAANVGEQDLRLGIDYVKYVADFTGVPLVSANLVDAAGAPVFQQYALWQIPSGDREATAAVIGVISTDFKEAIESLNPGLFVDEYNSTLDRLIGELGEKADFLILLAHASEEEARAAAERFPWIDFVISSHSGDDPFPVPAMAGDVPIVSAGINGMHAGVATLEMGKDRAKLLSFSPKKLDGTVGDSPRMVALLEEYQQMLRAEKLLDAVPRTDHPAAGFVGDDACLRCHSLSSYRFHKSKHAHAFEALVGKKHEYDPECVACHTVGFSYTSGFASPETTPELKDVGCENCHGPGGKHVEDALAEEYGEVARETCESCHNPENSPTFVYEDRIKEIKHNSFFPCSARICHWLD